jgi:hypothetical protein
VKIGLFQGKALPLVAGLSLAAACAAHPLDSWYSRFTNAPVTSFYSVAYGDGHYVAVGGSGAIARSTDGINWSVANPTTQTLNSIVYGKDTFVAVGNGGTILTSSNAIDWEDRSPGTNIYLQRVTWGNARFVALGYTISPACNWSLVSTDGLAWAHYYIASNKPTGELAFGNGLFVYPLSLGTNLLSTDGTAWWSQPAGLTNSLYMIGSGGNLLVAFDTRRLTFTSDDGTNWIFRGTNTLLRPEGMACGNGFWVAVSRGDNAQYSGDLIHWTPVTNGQTRAFAACFGNGSFLTSGSTICQSAPVILLQMPPGLAGAITIFGPTAVTYEIQALDDLARTNWQTLILLDVETTPYLWIDPDPTGPQKFYRALLP